jgi:hypothetical protein
VQAQEFFSVRVTAGVPAECLTSAIFPGQQIGAALVVIVVQNALPPTNKVPFFVFFLSSRAVAGSAPPHALSRKIAAMCQKSERRAITLGSEIEADDRLLRRRSWSHFLR